jgi:hypothetical protein
MQHVSEIMDRVSDRLVTLQASRWLPVLHRWLSQYRGLYEVIAGDSEAPESQIYTLLEQLESPVEDGDLAAQLARLDFLTWRARNDRQAWNPLEVPFHRFWADGIAIWQSDREYPEPAETARWLLACLRDIASCPIQ